MERKRSINQTQKAALGVSSGTNATELMKQALTEFNNVVKTDGKAIVFFSKGIDLIQLSVKIGSTELSLTVGGPAYNAGLQNQ